VKCAAAPRLLDVASSLQSAEAYNVVMQRRASRIGLGRARLRGRECREREDEYQRTNRIPSGLPAINHLPPCSWPALRRSVRPTKSRAATSKRREAIAELVQFYETIRRTISPLVQYPQAAQATIKQPKLFRRRTCACILKALIERPVCLPTVIRAESAATPALVDAASDLQ
jgi:hypothetical protein